MVLAERLAAGYGDDDPFVIGLARGAGPVTDRLIRITTALAVIAVAGVAAIISYQHAYELVTPTARPASPPGFFPSPWTDLIWAASMVVLDASRRNQPVPPLAEWSLAAGIVATVGANLANGIGHGPVGALVRAWPALALVGSFELLIGVSALDVPQPLGSRSLGPRYCSRMPVLARCRCARKAP